MANEKKGTFTFNLGIKAKTASTSKGKPNLYGKNGTIPKFTDYATNVAKRLAILQKTGIAPEGTKLLISTSEAVAVFPDGTTKVMFSYAKGDYFDIEVAAYDNSAELEAEKKAK